MLSAITIPYATIRALCGEDRTKPSGEESPSRKKPRGSSADPGVKRIALTGAARDAVMEASKVWRSDVRDEDLIEVSTSACTADDLTSLSKALSDHLATSTYDRSSAAYRTIHQSILVMTSVVHGMNDPSMTVPSLKVFPAAFLGWLRTSMIHGWVFMRGNTSRELVPWQVDEVTYSTGERHDNRPSVTVRMRACGLPHGHDRDHYDQDHLLSTSICLRGDEVVRKRVDDILRSRGIYHESQDLVAAYEQDLKTMLAFRNGNRHRQYVVRGMMVSASHAGDMMGSEHGSTRVIEDDPERSLVMESHDEVFLTSSAGSRLSEAQHNAVSRMPVHPVLWVFDLNSHQYAYAHVRMMTPYVYHPDLADKIVLPDTHRDLIDALVSDVHIIREDLIDGKTGGTTILCAGKPGLGKTLTAEVYSEVVGRPLYRIHSGQLGVDATSVEEHLVTALRRAERWKAILLIDEADVYIRRRNDDVDHNAIVAVFLRVLEYFSGILFMTTNRHDDIDDAIMSRCIATITYEPPTAEMQRKLWHVLAKQFQVSLSPSAQAVADAMTASYPHLTGRDIKELLKLSARYAERKHTSVTTDVIKRMAQFRAVGYQGR
jgi:hypothetical protein